MTTHSFLFQHTIKDGDIFQLKLSSKDDNVNITVKVYLKFSLVPVFDKNCLTRANILNQLYQHFIENLRGCDTPMARWTNIQFLSCEEKTNEGQDSVSFSRKLKNRCGILHSVVNPLNVVGQEFSITLITNTKEKKNRFVGGPSQDLLKEIRQKKGNAGLTSLLNKIKDPFLTSVNLGKGCKLHVGLIGKNKQFEPITQVSLSYITDNHLP